MLSGENLLTLRGPASPVNTGTERKASRLCPGGRGKAIMEKTITAEFDSVDQAAFALKNITDHFLGVSRVKLSRREEAHQRHGMELFTAPYGPVAANGIPQGMGFATAAGVESLAPAVATLGEPEEEWENPNDHQKTFVSLTVPERDAGRFSCGIYTGGGDVLKES